MWIIVPSLHHMVVSGTMLPGKEQVRRGKQDYLFAIDILILYLNFEIGKLTPRNVQWLVHDNNVKRVGPLSIASNLKVPCQLHNGKRY